MPLTCPDHTAPLTGPENSCPRCGGRFLSEEELTERQRSALAPETRIDCAAYARSRRCPQCETTLAPLRIGQLAAWGERCPSCGLHWFDQQDLRSLPLAERQLATRQAFSSLSAEEKHEVARDLASATGGDHISATHRLMALLGMPVVSRLERAKSPLATWGLALAIVLVTVIDWLSGGLDLAYASDDPSLLSSLTSIFIHAGVLHLVGNVYFLLAFGDGVEQRVPRWLLVGAFLCFGALSMVAEGLFSNEPTIILGASGAVAVLMGACFVLQPGARVAMGIGWAVVRVPMVAYGLLEFGYQTVSALLGVSGVAWLAHISGLAMGLAFGFLAKTLFPRPDVALG